MTDREEEAIRKAAYRLISSAIAGIPNMAIWNEAACMCSHEHANGERCGAWDRLFDSIESTRQKFESAGAVPLTPEVEEEPPNIGPCSLCGGRLVQDPAARPGDLVCLGCTDADTLEMRGLQRVKPPK